MLSTLRNDYTTLGHVTDPPDWNGIPPSGYFHGYIYRVPARPRRRVPTWAIVGFVITLIGTVITVVAVLVD